MATCCCLNSLSFGPVSEKPPHVSVSGPQEALSQGDVPIPAQALRPLWNRFAQRAGKGEGGLTDAGLCIVVVGYSSTHGVWVVLACGALVSSSS